jgi:hypothetical protein
MTTQADRKLRKRALTLLDIERSIFLENLGLLGYGQEKAAPIERDKSTKQPRSSFPTDTIPPASLSVH